MHFFSLSEQNNVTLRSKTPEHEEAKQKQKQRSSRPAETETENIRNRNKKSNRELKALAKDFFSCTDCCFSILSHYSIFGFGSSSLLRNRNLQLFYNMEGDDLPLQCDVCGKILPNKNSWLRHCKVTCPGPLPLPLFICPSNLVSGGALCSFSVTSRSLLEIHMNEAQHPYICKHANCDSTAVLWRFNYRLLNEHEKLPHKKQHLLQCPSNVSSHGAICSFSAKSRKALEKHMTEAQHPYPCPHENCTSSGMAWKFNFHQYSAHIKTPHSNSSKRKPPTIPATAPLEPERKSANTQTSVTDSEAEEASDEESPDSPRRVDSYHASIEEMVGVLISGT